MNQCSFVWGKLLVPIWLHQCSPPTGSLESVVSSPAGSAGQSPGRKRVLVHFELKTNLAMTNLIFLSFAGGGEDLGLRPLWPRQWLQHNTDVHGWRVNAVQVTQEKCSYFTPKLLLSDCQIWWRYLIKARRSYYKWKIFSTAFWPWPLKMLMLSFGADADHPYQISWKSDFQFREITTNATNELAK